MPVLKQLELHNQPPQFQKSIIGSTSADSKQLRPEALGRSEMLAEGWMEHSERETKIFMDTACDSGCSCSHAGSKDQLDFLVVVDNNETHDDTPFPLILETGFPSEATSAVLKQQGSKKMARP